MKELEAVVAKMKPQERALKAMRERLANGAWSGGERLPPETELSEALGVSRPTLRAALATLESEGAIEARGRRGRIVAEGAGPAPDGVMAGTLVVATHRMIDAPPGYHGGSIDAIESGILDEAHAHGLNVLRLHRERLSPPTCAWLRANPPAGLLLTPQVAYLPEAAELAGALRAGGVPVVSNEAAPGLGDVDLVLFDHAGGAAALVRWLIARGCRRVLPFWSTTERGVAWIEDRERGYAEAMRAAGLAALEPVRCDLPPRAAGRDDGAFAHRVRHCLGYLHEHVVAPVPVDAVMLLDDSSVFPFLGACQLAGWRVGPDGLEFTGFDDYWRECWERELQPLDALATIDKQNYLAGQEMVRTAIRRRADSHGAPIVLRVPFCSCLPM